MGWKWEWNPLASPPPPKGYDFLELPHFLKLGGGTGQAWTFFFLLWSNAAAIPQGASVLRDQICCIWSLSIDLGGQRLGGLGREGALQYSHVGQENPNSESGLPFPRKKGSGSQEHPGRHGWSQLTIDGYKDPRPEPAAGEKGRHPSLHPLDPSIQAPHPRLFPVQSAD